MQIVQLINHLGQKRRLHRGLASGKRYSAFAIAEQFGLAVEPRGQFGRSINLPHHPFPARNLNDLRQRRKPFRIVTPRATQPAPFQEYSDPNAGTIMDGKFLEVEDDPGSHRPLNTFDGTATGEAISSSSVQTHPPCPSSPESVANKARPGPDSFRAPPCPRAALWIAVPIHRFAGQTASAPRPCGDKAVPPATRPSPRSSPCLAPILARHP